MSDPQYQDLVVAAPVRAYWRINRPDLFGAELAAYQAHRAEKRLYSFVGILPITDDKVEAARTDYCNALRVLYRGLEEQQP